MPLSTPALVLACLLHLCRGGHHHHHHHSPLLDKDVGATSDPVAPSDGDSCLAPLSFAINDFAQSVWSLLRRDHNMVLSPLSVSALLAMSFHGARGDTSVQLKDVLLFSSQGLSYRQVSAGFLGIHQALAAADPDENLLLANQLILDSAYDVYPKYARDLTVVYRASVMRLRFEKRGAYAMRQINSWVSERTRRAIPKVLSEPVWPEPKMLLLSVVYFRGLWKVPFPKQWTEDGFFYLHSGKKNLTKMVKLMHLHKQHLPYLDDDRTQFQFVELPYAHSDLAMLLALPRERHSHPYLDMSSELICYINDSLRVTKLYDVFLPRFKISLQSQLKQPLLSVGLTEMFDPDKANLTGISPHQDLSVSDVIHHAVVDVSEEGVRKPSKDSQHLSKFPWDKVPKVPNFVANHPFSLFVINKKNGVILLSAQVMDPSQELTENH